MKRHRSTTFDKRIFLVERKKNRHWNFWIEFYRLDSFGLFVQLHTHTHIGSVCVLTLWIAGLPFASQSTQYLLSSSRSINVNRLWHFSCTNFARSLSLRLLLIMFGFSFLFLFSRSLTLFRLHDFRLGRLLWKKWFITLLQQPHTISIQFRGNTQQTALNEWI